MKRGALTLVELLIIIAIIGVLFALLLPIISMCFSGSSTIQDAKVTKTETIYERYGRFGETKYIVFTNKGAFSVKPSVYGIVEIGQVYDIEAYGWEPMWATKFELDEKESEAQ